MKISGIYQIVNTITGDCYIGSTIDLDKRKREHFNESYWKHNPNKKLYKDMKQYGKNNFLFKPLWLCDPYELKKYEQIAIEKYNPKYNIRVAYTGVTREEYVKQYNKQYYKENTDKIKQYRQENADNIKQRQKQYNKEHADSIKQKKKQYRNQQCLYKNELLSLNALRIRFYKKGIKNPTQEAKKYLIGE